MGNYVAKTLRFRVCVWKATIKARGCNLGVFVRVWLVLPQCEATNVGVFDLRHFDLLKRGCANSVVGLELTELSLERALDKET